MTVSLRAPTLGGTLSPSLYNSSKSCSDWLQFKGCSCCPHILKGDTIQVTTTDKSAKILPFINCNTRYLVYINTCKSCQNQYVDQTTRRLLDRLHDHLYDIEKNHNTNVARHWNDKHQKGVSNLVIQAIERIVLPARGGDKFRILCKREVYWIFFFNTRKPAGLNFEWDVSHFYK